jgi:protein-tyrosine phosphatase
VIDIHSHILYGLDDGAKTLGDSVAMVQMALANGTTEIVATPHANQEYKFDPVVIERKIAELQDAVGERPRIYFGCDFHLTPENIDDALLNWRKYSINHTGYLLVEFSDFYIPKNTQEIFARLMAANLRPVVTHPERNQLLQHRIPDLAAWVEHGAYLQITAQSFDGRFGRKAKRVSDALMEAGLVHFIASDAHDRKWRTTPLNECFDYIAKDYGREAALRIFEENPRAALAGLPLPEWAVPAKRREWYRFW